MAVIGASFFLRSPDVYDSLQIFLQETGSQEIGALVCGLAFSGVELPSYAAHILLELLLIAIGLSWEPVHLYHRGLDVMH